ncbi:MAG TPA: TetR/AcrR family transcriptional regulator [Solimonas sp.]|nr:TetR/AcrR family transcriptional regulator [Solimonas sp.]
MQTSRGKREQNKQANRAAILEAARRLFAEQGYDAVTVRDVIRCTSLAAGTFYNYFPDKESLLRALVEERLEELTGRVSHARRSADTIEQFVHGAYLTVFEGVCASPEFYRMMFRNEPVIRAFYGDNVFGYTLRTIKIDLADAIARGLIADHNIDYLTAIFFGAGYEVSRLLVDQAKPDPQDAADFATQVFVQGLAALAPPSPSAPLIHRGPLKLRGAAR